MIRLKIEFKENYIKKTTTCLSVFHVVNARKKKQKEKEREKKNRNALIREN
jgi:hypothetical protein